jgi:hypothetical protein
LWLFFGLHPNIELPKVQRNFLKALKEAGKKVVFVNCSGSAIALTPETESCDAILQAWYPGQDDAGKKAFVALRRYFINHYTNLIEEILPEGSKDYSEYFKGPNLKEAQKRSRKQVDHLKDAFEIPSDMVSVGKGKTYYIHTYGCQANERDGETLAGIFEMMGYTAAKEIEEADVILLNT